MARTAKNGGGKLRGRIKLGLESSSDKDIGCKGTYCALLLTICHVVFGEFTPRARTALKPLLEINRADRHFLRS